METWKDTFQPMPRVDMRDESPVGFGHRGPILGLRQGYNQLDFQSRSWVLSQVGSEYDGHCQPEHTH